MKTPSARLRKIAALSAGPIAVLIAGGMVWQGSQAAFTATTRNAGNSWAAGSVVLTDDDLGAAAFTVENIVPGQTGQKCIVVTSNADVAGFSALFKMMPELGRFKLITEVARAAGPLTPTTP